jgi:hypothetical protein
MLLIEGIKIKIKDRKEDNLMECAWFFTELNENTEKKISDIVKKLFYDSFLNTEKSQDLFIKL